MAIKWQFSKPEAAGTDGGGNRRVRLLKEFSYEIVLLFPKFL